MYLEPIEHPDITEALRTGYPRQWQRRAYDPDDDDNWDDYTYNDPDDEDIAQPETRENGGPGT